MKAIIIQPGIFMPITNEKITVQPRESRTKGWLILAIAMGVILLHPSAFAGQKSLLNYNFKTVMTGTEIDENARGTVLSKLVRTGNGDHQRLTISLAMLAPNTAYHLTALVGDETASTHVAEFTTDGHGSFVFAYSKTRVGQSVPRMHLLPASLDPICNVRELNVINGNAQTVLHAALSEPTRKHYLVSRPLLNSGFNFSAAGILNIRNTRHDRFQLLISGLTPSTDYILFANGGAGQTLTSDRFGKLKRTTLPEGFSNSIEINSLGLSDMNGNLILSTTGLGIPCAIQSAPSAPQAPVNMGSAAGFAVLAGSTVTSSGLTIINNGDVGVSAGTAVEGFPPAVINNGSIHSADIAAGTAQLDLTTAYNDAKGRTVGPVSVAGNLGGRTLAPGLYKSTSSLEISSGDLTLNAQGDANAVFIFQIASTLSTTSDRKVFLTGNAKAANVFWQVGTSAVLGTGSVFKGTIMADQSITLTTGTVLEGRALARIAAVSLGASTVTTPAP